MKTNYDRELAYVEEIKGVGRREGFTWGLVWGLPIGGAITALALTWRLIF